MRLLEFQESGVENLEQLRTLKEIIRICAANDCIISHSDAYKAWKKYSKSMGSEWVNLPTGRAVSNGEEMSDDQIFNQILYHTITGRRVMVETKVETKLVAT